MTDTQPEGGAIPLEAIETLSKYTACDISDALLKLKIPGAGFLADISLHSPLLTPETSIPPIIAPAFTVRFVALDEAASTPSNIPKGTHFADLSPPNTIVVLSQPAGQRNAVLGGLVAARMKVLGVRAVVVDGRIRDLGELREGLDGFPVWAKGTSTVGAGAESKAVEVGGKIMVEGVGIEAGDIIFADALNGVVAIPRAKLDEVLALLPKITGADDKVRLDVLKGRPLQEAFNEHRKAL